MTTTESKIETGTRPITRADEARAREAVTKAEASIRWIARREPMLSWTDAGALFAINGYRSEGTGTLWDEFAAALARAGIVPGADGWCWAAAEPAPAETPAWLRDAVLAALPVDGTPVSTNVVGGIPYGLMGECVSAIPDGATLTEAMVGQAIASLVAAGEIEVSHDDDGRATWRRWGVPEGADWQDFEDGVSCLLQDGRGTLARVERDGAWKVWRAGSECLTKGTGGKRAALRACWERGVFAPLAPAQPKAEPAAEPTTAPPTAAPTRAEQVRHALLAVLTRGPVEGFNELCVRLTADGLVDAPTMAEARRAAREIGALVNGARWSLPDVPPGWGWTAGGALTRSALKRGRWHLANVRSDGFWCVYPGPGEDAIDDGGAADPIAAQAAAIYAARRAGLFAVDAPAEHEAPAERLPDPAGVALSPERELLDDARQAGDVDRLFELADRWLHEAMRARPVLDALRAYGARESGALDMLRSVAGKQSDAIGDALRSLACTLDTGPSHAEQAEPAPEPVDATRWPRAVLARALASLATGDALDKALDAWGASLIAEARRGLTVPHAVVYQHLAERAYAEDALYLFDVYQAAMRVRDHVRAHEPSETDAIGALCALLDREPKPREPEPHPHRDGNEEPWETIERIARERDEARLEAEAAERRANAAQRDARGLADDRNKAIRRAEKAEAGLAALRQAIDDLGATWAKGRAT